MAGENEEIVKDVSVVRIDGGAKDEKDADDTSDDADQEETSDEAEESDDSKDKDDSEDSDELIDKKADDTDGNEDEDDDGLKDVPGETPKERALRKEVTTLKGKLRGERKEELLGDNKAPARVARSRELNDQEKTVIGKYKPEDLAALREVLPILAKEQGYVKEDQLAQETYSEKSQGYLDTFLEKHQEYIEDPKLWEAFKQEFSLYKQPTDPKEFPKIFNRIHKDVFGIKTVATALPKVKAQEEKKQVASHTGATRPNTPSKQRTAASGSGFRTDMLKGFSDEEKEDMFGE